MRFSAAKNDGAMETTNNQNQPEGGVAAKISHSLQELERSAEKPASEIFSDSDGADKAKNRV